MTRGDDAEQRRDADGLDPNDPYRYGLPDRPPPPEFAPPGWTPPAGYYLPPPPPPGPHGPYGPPPPGWLPPPQHAWEQREPGRGKAITALVLGIASIPLCLLSFLDFFLVMAAVAFGATALTDHLPGRPSPGRSYARAGLICAAIGGVLAIIVTVVVLVKVRDDCGFGNGVGRFGTDSRYCVTR